jgi:hypothetical protein
MNCISKEKAKGKGLVILTDASFGITCNVNMRQSLSTTAGEVSMKTPHKETPIRMHGEQLLSQRESEASA